MGPRLTFCLVGAAAVTLVLGFAIAATWLIYLSIGCSALAAVALMLATRRTSKGRRTQAEVESNRVWTASLAEPEVGPVVASAAASAPAADPVTAPVPVVPTSLERPADTPVPAAVAAEPGAAETGAAAEPGAARVSRTTRVPAASPFAPPRPAPVAGGANRYSGVRLVPASEVASAPHAAPTVRPRVPKRVSVASPSSRPSVTAAASAATTGPAVARGAARPAPARTAAGGGAAARAARSPSRTVRRPAPPVEAYPFPIEDYKDLTVDEILPLLPELDDQELVEVLLFEHGGPKRPEILARLDSLLEGEG